MTPPGARLSSAIAPIAYDVALDLDPDRPGFRGHVEIRVRAASATDVVWLHAVDLELAAATVRVGAARADLARVGSDGAAQGFRLPRPLAIGEEATLEFDYGGGTGTDAEGLFREALGGRWYLFSQSEAAFARRILPCFDEPRWKPTWTVHLAVPRGMGAFANAPERARHERADGKVVVDFAPTPPMPSALFAVAAGPFEVVALGAVGRARVPARVLAPAGVTAAPLAAERLPPIVAALEAYFDDALPVAKLDLVAVPRFFGGMENPGLITMSGALLLGDPAGPAERRRFQRFAAHELAHLWLGDLVTPAWWDELWLAEAFATWLADEVLVGLDGLDDPALRAAQARERAFDADGAPAPRPLRRPVARSEDADSAFDAIAYDKGAAVLATIERWVSADGMRQALRAYVRAHAGGTATSADFVAAFGGAPPAIADVLGSYTEHAGVPVVDLALRCGDGPPRVSAAVRAPDTAVPVCVRYPTPTATAVACAVAIGAGVEIPLPSVAACPAWVLGNADGAGYYATAWDPAARAGRAPVLAISPAERMADGRDVATAVARGDVGAREALGELTRLSAVDDPYAALAALAVARALAPLVDDAAAPRWAKVLVDRFGARLEPAAMIAPATPAWRAARDRLLELVPADRLPPATVARARAELDRAIAAGAVGVSAAPVDVLAALVGPTAGPDRRAALLALAGAADSPALAEDVYAAVGELAADAIPDAVAAVIAHPRAGAWLALHTLLERPATAAQAWAAVRAQLPAITDGLSPTELGELVGAAASLCEPRAAAQVAVALEPILPRVPGGRAALDRALAVADRCVARRTRAAMGAALPR